MAFLCCPGRAPDASKLDSSREEESDVERSPAELANTRSQHIRQSLTHADVAPLARSTRDTDTLTRQSVAEQRRSASITMTSISEHIGQQPSSVKSLRMSRMSFGSHPSSVKSLRMSRMSFGSRGMLVKKLEAASKGNLPRQPGGHAAVLLDRLAGLGLASVEMDGDGNCQFRALADQLLGSQRHHEIVRAAAVAHMRAAADYFGMFFETADEFHDYLTDMGHSCTWGDELTLRAAVEAFGCVAHVVTSEPSNWYLVYTPEAPPPDEVCALVGQRCRGSKRPQPPSGKEVFINYISPIHYNAVSPLGKV